MREDTTDAIVIGGGPAGSAYAITAVRAGLTVKIIEGKHFPRHHIGESLLAMSMPLLEHLGVVPLLDEAGFLPKSGAVFVWGNSSTRIDLGFPEPRRAYQVRRGLFDQLLLRHAAHTGAEVLSGQWAKEPVRAADGRVIGVISDGEHGATRHCAKFVVDATGLFQFMPKRLGLAVDVSGPRRVAISGYYHDAGRVSGEHANNIISEATRDGWLWFIPLDDTTTSVGFVGDEVDLAGKPDAVLAEQIATSRLIRSLLGDAVPDGHARLLRYTNHIVADPLWRHGCVLIGDTGLFVDPLFSTGVHGALYTGISAAAAAVAHLVDGLPEADLATWYDQTARGHYARVQTMVGLLYGINGGASRFWRTRDLRAMTAVEAERIITDLGPVSIPLFLTGHRLGTLDIPPALVPWLESRGTRPTTAIPVTAAAITLAPTATVRETYTRRGDHVVPALGVYAHASHPPAVRVPADSPAAELLRRLAVGPVAHAQWHGDPHLTSFVSVLHSSGLLDPRIPSAEVA